MITRIVMPKIDANVEEATVGKWLKAEGAPFGKGDPLVEIITDKANFELEADHAGILRHIVAVEKSTVPIGYILALASENTEEKLPDVEQENSELVRKFKEKAGLALSGPETTDSRKPDSERPAKTASTRVRATPAARRLARKHSIDLAGLAGESRHMITEKDIRDAIGGQGRRTEQ